METKTKDKHNKPFPWRLGIFPLLEFIFFLLAYSSNHYFISFLLILVASILLSFSVHIFFHECVHLRKKYPMPINILFSLLLGMPFDGYRVHHFNHHTYSNGLDDFSSTWYFSKGKKTAYSVWNYCFAWLRQVLRLIRSPNPFDPVWGELAPIKARIQPQKIALFIGLIILALLSLKAFILYFLLIYFGWVFTSLHNYGQHPPRAEEPICTYANKRFNTLFFNNGLHWEHHNKPWLSWNHIKLDANSPRIQYAHLINPFFEKNHDRQDTTEQ